MDGDIFQCSMSIHDQCIIRHAEDVLAKLMTVLFSADSCVHMNFVHDIVMTMTAKWCKSFYNYIVIPTAVYTL